MNKLKQLTAAGILFLAVFCTNQTKAQDNAVVWTMVVQMDAAQAQSNSESFGQAILRVTADKKLTYKFIIHNIDDGDGLTNSHIHTAPVGQDGPPFIFMQAGVQNLNRNITIQLTDAQYEELVNGTQPIYINIHSHIYPGDSIRGQIR